MPENGASDKTKLNQFSISSQNDYRYSQGFDVSIGKDSLEKKKKQSHILFLLVGRIIENLKISSILVNNFSITLWIIEVL